MGMNGGLGRCASESVCSESGTFVIWRFCPPSFLGGREEASQLLPQAQATTTWAPRWSAPCPTLLDYFLSLQC